MLTSNNLKKVKLELNSANESKTILDEDDPCVNTFSGTPGQVEVTQVGTDYSFSTPQDIATTSNPTFNTVIAKSMFHVSYSGTDLGYGIARTSGGATEIQTAGAGKLRAYNDWMATAGQLRPGNIGTSGTGISEAYPAIALGGTSTGFYSPSAGVVRVTNQGTTTTEFSSSGVEHTVPLQATALTVKATDDVQTVNEPVEAENLFLIKATSSDNSHNKAQVKLITNIDKELGFESGYDANTTANRYSRLVNTTGYDLEIDCPLDMKDNNLSNLGELGFSGPQMTLRSDVNHGYIEFYNTKQAGRSAYLGFGSGGSNNLTLSNEINGGSLVYSTNNGNITFTSGSSSSVQITRLGTASIPALTIADNNTGLYAKAANKLTLCAAGGDFLTVDGVTSPFGIDFHDRYIRNLAGGSQSLTFSGPWATNQTVTVSWKIYDGFVILNVPYMIAAATSSSASLISTTTLPSTIRPTNISHCYALVNRNSTTTSGTFSIDTGGTIRIAPVNASFTGTGNEGAYNSSYTFKL